MDLLLPLSVSLILPLPLSQSSLGIGVKQCPVGEIPCRTGNKCIPEHNVCNGIHDCEDGSDEKLSECSPFIPDQVTSTPARSNSVVPKEETTRSEDTHRNEVDNYPSSSNYHPHHHAEEVSRTTYSRTPDPYSSSHHHHSSGKFQST